MGAGLGPVRILTKVRELLLGLLLALLELLFLHALGGGLLGLLFGAFFLGHIHSYDVIWGFKPPQAAVLKSNQSMGFILPPHSGYLSLSP